MEENEMKKFLTLVSVIMVVGMILTACGTKTETPAVVETTVATEAPTEVPVRKGPWVDEIVFTAIADMEPAVAQIQAGAIDMYPVTGDDAQVFANVKADPTLQYVTTVGGFNQLMYNTVQCTDTTILNPFTNQKIREAMNWAVDREFIVNEIFAGLATARYTLLTTAFPDYARYAAIVGKMIAKYGYNLAKATEVVDTEMVAMGATKGADGKWQFGGKPVVIIALIRPEDKRKEVGDYFATQLETLGFTVDRQYKVRKEAGPIWQGDPYPCTWTYYTAGWISTAISRDEGNMFAQYNTGRIQGIPLFYEYQPSAEYDVILTKLQTNDFKDMAERDALFAQALEMSMTESWHGLMINDNIAFEPYRADIQVASDLAAGIAPGTLWASTLRIGDTEGGTVKVAQSGILVQPWNPLNGSNWVDDGMPQKATMDYGVMYDPYTGLTLPERIESASIVAKEGLPIRKSLDWIDLSFVPEIQVPADAWADWDAAAGKFVTVGEKFPEGTTANAKATVTYPSSLWETKWHDGSNLSVADFVMYMIQAFEAGKPESKIYDEAQAASLEVFLSHFKGVKIVSTDPLVIETYDDLYALDAELSITTWYPSNLAPYGYGTAPWYGMVPAILAEENGELAFGTDKAGALGVEWTSFISGPSLETQKKYLDQALAESYIPYAATLSAYVTPEQAAAGYQALEDWYAAKGHLWVGTGPFYVDQVFPVEGTIVLKKFADFSDPSDKWAGFGKAKIAEATVEGPASVKIGEEVTFDVMVTFEGAAYPADELGSVTYIVKDANGDIALDGAAEFVADGQYSVTLTSAQTTLLAAGSNKLTVAIASNVVAIPTFASVEFVTTAP